MRFEISVADLSSVETKRLIEAHLAHSAESAPATSNHSLAIEALREPRASVWSISDGEALLGCGALYELDARHGEVKSMHTTEAARGRGVGAAMLEHLIAEGRRRGYERLSLETGAMDAYARARRLYARFGFEVCAPFADYVEDPNSVYMTLRL